MSRQVKEALKYKTISAFNKKALKEEFGHIKVMANPGP